TRKQILLNNLNKTFKKIFSIIIPLLLGIFFVVYAYQQFSEEQIIQIKDSFKSANYSYIYISIGFGFVGAFARAYRWRFTLEHLGYKVPFKNQFCAVNIGYLMNMFVSRSGEISRAVVLT